MLILFSIGSFVHYGGTQEMNNTNKRKKVRKQSSANFEVELAGFVLAKTYLNSQPKCSRITVIISK